MFCMRFVQRFEYFNLIALYKNYNRMSTRVPAVSSVVGTRPTKIASTEMPGWETAVVSLRYDRMTLLAPSCRSRTISSRLKHE